ncbi:uncharacterized protein LOC106471259 [Limulus polyphemus]|uniref:Uncharacterized protein LOC106471259 n=1 Tax=Limulus polyphemus TaxID=6850 RepID=A0ABM1BRK9_LIMPO|nr:uncharacterized protein LOC106471259 [Limulus polyphemus]
MTKYKTRVTNSVNMAITRKSLLQFRRNQKIKSSYHRKSFRCNGCQKSFLDQAKLIRHKKLTLVSVPDRCGRCELKLSSNSNEDNLYISPVMSPFLRRHAIVTRNVSPKREQVFSGYPEDGIKSNDENEGEVAETCQELEETGHKNVFHLTLRNNWSKLVTDKISALVFSLALKGHHQCPKFVGFHF